jgi:hypothetical protein
MSDPGDQLPALRASDAEREQTADILRGAASEGRLDVEELNVYSIMGGAEVRVPHGVEVQVTNFALMGGNGVERDDEVTPSGGPVIRIRLVSVMGGTGLKRGRKLSKRQRKELELREGSSPLPDPLGSRAWTLRRDPSTRSATTARSAVPN